MISGSAQGGKKNLQDFFRTETVPVPPPIFLHACFRIKSTDMWMHCTSFPLSVLMWTWPVFHCTLTFNPTCQPILDSIDLRRASTLIPWLPTIIFVFADIYARLGRDIQYPAVRYNFPNLCTRMLARTVFALRRGSTLVWRLKHEETLRAIKA